MSTGAPQLATIPNRINRFAIFLKAFPVLTPTRLETIEMTRFWRAKFGRTHFGVASGPTSY
jgi:hypothetical protein